MLPTPFSEDYWPLLRPGDIVRFREEDQQYEQQRFGSKGAALVVVREHKERDCVYVNSLSNPISPTPTSWYKYRFIKDEFMTAAQEALR